jgi:SAM-dependent methyltransferase
MSGGPFPTVERHGRFVLRRCRDCDVQFADPMEEARREFYEQHVLYCGPEACFTSPRLLNWDQRCFLRDRPCPGGALLDVGCGTGQFAEAARRAGYTVTGLDLSRSQLALAGCRFPLVTFHPLTLAEYAATAGRPAFDVVTAFQVLEHVARPMAFIGQVRELLVPGGCFAVGVPGWRAWRVLRDPLDAPPNHLTRWSRQSLVGALEHGGLEVLRVREHRSLYNFLLRHLRLGLLRRLMSRSARGATTGASPSAVVLGLSVAKARLLMALDVPAGALLTAMRAPGVTLYALARVKR